MEKRTVIFDKQLEIEGYRFEGIKQQFPNHFHDHYVIGIVGAGNRRLLCGGETFIIEPGDLVIFNPRVNHACEQVEEHPLDWRCLNIGLEVMARIVEEITGERYLPLFERTVVRQCELAAGLKELHKLVMNGHKGLGKEELFYFFMEQLISDYAACRAELLPAGPGTLGAVCQFIEHHYMDSVSLADLSRAAGMKNYALLRRFTLEKGITPYQYLTTIRINKAKTLLEDGLEVSETAYRTGFADQSHLTRFFKRFIGVTPKVYQNMFCKTRQR